jgi:hypothetical protein
MTRTPFLSIGSAYTRRTEIVSRTVVTNPSNLIEIASDSLSIPSPGQDSHACPQIAEWFTVHTPPTFVQIIALSDDSSTEWANSGTEVA